MNDFIGEGTHSIFPDLSRDGLHGERPPPFPKKKWSIFLSFSSNFFKVTICAPPIQKFKKLHLQIKPEVISNGPTYITESNKYLSWAVRFHWRSKKAQNCAKAESANVVFKIFAHHVRSSSRLCNKYVGWADSEYFSDFSPISIRQCVDSKYCFYH